MKRIFLTIFLFSLSLVVFRGVSLLAFENLANLREAYLKEVTNQIVESMKVDDLVGQVIHIAIPTTILDEVARNEMDTIHPGGVIHFGKNLGSPTEIIDLNKNLQDKAKSLGLPPLLISTDQEGGRVYRVREGVTAFPGAMAVGQTNSRELGEAVGFMTSYQLAKLGINFLLAPILDINNNPENPVINTRSFGSSKDMVTKVAVAYMEGAKLGGAIPVIKHFPGHGDTNVDSHLGLPKIEKSMSELENFELIPFQEAIQKGAPAVMSAHIVYPKVDAKYPATLSPILLNELLRKKMGFKGVVITDAMEMHAISKNYQDQNPAVRAILAGADIILLTSWGSISRNFHEEIKKSYLAGEFNREGKDILKEAVSRQIRLKLEYGIYENEGFMVPTHPNSIVWNQFLFEKQKERERKYFEINQGKNIEELVNRKSIRSYPGNFTYKNEELHFYILHPYLSQYLKDRNIKNKQFQESDFKKGKGIWIRDTKNEADLQALARVAKSNPDQLFIALYPSTPFVILPKEKNLKILFSFSNTNGSYKGFLDAILSGEEIPEVDLVFKMSN